MMRSDQNGDRLEAVVEQAVGGLPDRPAPEGLEARVLKAIEARAAMPWWQASFVAWPAAARVAFVLLCLALVLCTVLLGHTQPLEAPAQWLRQALAVFSSVSGFFALFGRLVPDTWLYALLGVGGALYALLFGLGAIVYRTLYLPSFKR